MGRAYVDVGGGGFVPDEEALEFFEALVDAYLDLAALKRGRKGKFTVAEAR